MNTIEQARKVKTKAEFVSHLQSLARYIKEHPEDIENHTVETFLEGIASWIEDSEGFYLNQGRPVPEIDDWSPIAELMSAGLTYE